MTGTEGIAMPSSYPYALDEVARHLNLPEGVVLRLSHYFQIPHAFFNAQAGHPKLFLYQAQEVAYLETIQERLVTGDSLPDIKASLTPLVMEEASPDLSPLSDEEDWPQRPSSLVAYGDDSMKETLAHRSFQQYQYHNRTQEAPFKKLAQAFQEEHHRTRRQPMVSPLPLSNAEPELKVSLPVGLSPFSGLSAMTTPAWMPSHLRDKALTLQQEWFVNATSTKSD